jgi:ATP-dependent Clp protease ATP-binding subunit ClpA
LDVEARKELLVRALAALGAELRSRGVDIQITPEAHAWVLAVAGVDQSARELIRWFEREVRGPTLGYVSDTSEASQVHLRMGKAGLTRST